MVDFFTGTDYQGVSFNTVNDALILIRDNLTSVGWVVELDDISANSTLKLQGEDINNTSNKCYFIFQVDVNGDLEIKGYLGGTNDAGEESASYTLELTDGTDNKLWLTADSGSGAIMVLDGNVGFAVRNSPAEFYLNGLNAVHFGFLERVSLNDEYAWMIGRIDYNYETSQVARRFTGTNDAWLVIASDYRNTGNDYGGSYLTVPVTTFDPIMYATMRNDFKVKTEPNDNRPLDVAPKGSFNGVDGFPYFGNFYYIEGRKDDSNNDDYGENLIVKPLIYRGNVKFAATGLASALALDLYSDNFGNVYISTNNYGAQAMRVG